MKVLKITLVTMSLLLVNTVFAQFKAQKAIEVDPKQVVEQYFTYLHEGDLESLGNLFAEDIVWHQPGNGELSGKYQGKAQLFALFGEFMTRSNGTFKIDEVSKLMVNGNLVIANLHFSANREGRSISMDGVDLMKVLNGKIIEVHLFSENQNVEDEFWKN